MRVKNEKGITVISLLIAIIVMLILAGVTLGTISTNENRFDEMAEVTKDYSLQGLMETVRMAEIYLKLDGFTNHRGFDIYDLMEKVYAISHIDTSREYETKYYENSNTKATIINNKMKLQVDIEIENDNSVTVKGKML